jgi:hypothetical protein
MKRSLFLPLLLLPLAACSGQSTPLAEVPTDESETRIVALTSLTTALATTLETDPQPLLDRYDACLAQAPMASPSSHWTGPWCRCGWCCCWGDFS